MPEPYDIVTELSILKKAAHLLLDVGQLTDADASLIAAQVRNVLTTGARHLPLSDEIVYDMTLVPHANHGPEGFTVPERVAQLGYRLTVEQYRDLVPGLPARIRRAWATRFEVPPIRVEGEDWYLEQEAVWVDPVIENYLAQCPGVERTQPVEE